MTIVRHPTLKVQIDVPAERVAGWVAAGWVSDAAIDTEEIRAWGGDVIATHTSVHEDDTESTADHN